MSTRNLLLKGALLAAVLAAALLASPRFVQRAYATAAGCKVTCNNGVCEADPEAGEECTCACGLLGAAKCTCKQAQLVPVTGS